MKQPSYFHCVAFEDSTTYNETISLERHTTAVHAALLLSHDVVIYAFTYCMSNVRLVLMPV